MIDEKSHMFPFRFTFFQKERVLEKTGNTTWNCPGNVMK